ncbi:hypothetical protein I1E95_15105 [Synechococcus sp. CBW1107]|uniref:hypothetical protein n=1 Tax=Synechococcus sp. CBW1107 TaxID=2789857 RepID=UPI0018CCCEC5|nr:hypothetical protein [Synechococcus sp. CBW1107]QPN56383.1 hypothetical protein I1E95_15105 [Synechococcus sp. CBW1107]
MKTPPKPTRQGRGGLSLLGGGGLLLGLSVALIVGLQLGALPWKFRRQMFQLQGSLAGGLVGFAVGWGLGRSRREPGSDDS